MAVVVIGEEILSGKFADENGPYLVRRLRELGADLRRLVVIGDGVDEIADEVGRSAARFERVITTGGVGPTHDDRTFAGVAAAFGRPLVEHPELRTLLLAYGLPENDATLRMARVPEGATLEAGSARSYPVVRVDGVFVFPGVPRLMQAKFEAIRTTFAGPTVHVARLVTDLHETDIAADLTEVQEAEPTVAIGSYPRFGEGPFRVILTLESRDAEAVARARAALVARIPTLPE